MNRFFKETALIALLSVLLLLLAFAPSKSLQDSADALVDVHHLFDFEPENFHESLYTFDGDAFARLHAIGQMNVKAEDLVISGEQNSGQDLMPAVEEQFVHLQYLGALPELPVRTGYSFGQRRFLYIDSNDPSVSIPVWELLLECDDVCLCVFMDAETHVLYDVFVWSPDGDLGYDETEFSGAGFFEYLLAHSASHEVGNELFEVHSEYTHESIRLHAISFDTNGIHRSYSFWALEDFDENGDSVTGGYIKVSPDK